MINTIFYFPESLTFDQYLDALNSNTDDGIASRTIVFAKQLGKIYNNGKIYGTTYSDVQNLIELNRYDDKEVRAAIEQLKRDLQSESEAIDLQGLRYLALAGRVKTVEDHGYVNESEILTAVAGEIDGSTQKSSIRNKVNNVAKEASAALFTEVSDQNDNITALSIVNAITSNSTAKANLASSFNSGDNTMWANVVTQTDLNSATSALYAALQNKANDSEVVKKASIIASINSSGESNVSINADKIQLNGTAVANCLMAAQAVLGGFTIENSKLSNSAVEFNADGSGYLAAGAIKWTSAGALDINADGLLLDVEHPWTWAQWFGNNTPVKGLAAFGIVGDYSNLKYKASYNFDTGEYTYIPALGNQDTGLSSDPKEATRGIANALSSAIFDGSGFGICLLNPAIDTQRLHDNVSQFNTGTGIYEIESGINNIHPCVNLHAALFDPSYHRLAKECTSGLYINNHTLIGGSLIVNKNVYTPSGGLYFGGDHNISLNKLSNQYRLTLNTSSAVDIAAPDEICLEADNTYCWGNLTAEKIIKNNGTSDQFLKADGSVTTLKTINGNSLEGTGDIVISGGGSSSVDWSNVQNKPTNVSAFTNDAGYLTTHQSLAGYLPLTGGTLTGALNIDKGASNIILDFGGIELIQSGSDFKIYADHNFITNKDSLIITNLVGNTIGTIEIRHNKLSVDNSITATSFIKSGGTSAQFLKADGSVDSNTYIPTTGGNVSGELRFLSDDVNRGVIFGDQTGLSIQVAGSGILSIENAIEADNTIKTEGFIKRGGTANEVLMADGSTMTLAELKAALNAI